MKKIAVIGDVMLDKYDYCSNRDNPENSAPCYRIERTEFKPGGAGNVAANLTKLGSETILIGVVGNDHYSDHLIEVLEKSGIKHFFIKDKERQTVVKERTLSSTDGRYHIRKDREQKRYIDDNHVAEIIEKIKGYDMIVVSDYNKGTVSRSLMERVISLNIPAIVDPKPIHRDFYKNVFMITPNVKEAREMAGLEDELSAAEKLKTELNTNILLTRSEHGIMYLGLDGQRIEFPADTKKVFDVTGAGDTVLASFAHFHLKGYPLEGCIKFANKAAGIAVGYPGCYQVSENEII